MKNLQSKRRKSVGPTAKVQTKGETTRTRMIEVATKLFLTKGLYNVTVGEISKGAKVSQPALYKYFKDMDELFLEACKHWVNESTTYITEQVDDLSSARLQLKQYLERHLIYAAKNRAHDALLFGLYYYSMRSTPMLQVYQGIKAGALAKIERILKLGNLDKSWSVNDPARTAETLHSLLVGEVIKLLIEPNSESTESRLSRVYQMIDAVLLTRLGA